MLGKLYSFELSIISEEIKDRKNDCIDSNRSQHVSMREESGSKDSTSNMQSSIMDIQPGMHEQFA